VESKVIAIDGPAASGKSTVARNVAKELCWIYVDSGSIYRGVTWWALEQGVNVENADELKQLLDSTHWEFSVNENIMQFQIEGVNPGQQIRSQAVADHVSHVAQVPEVRQYIVEQIRSMKQFGNLVVEGRDIGSVVFPNTELKFYLDADPDERARRRAVEFTEQGESDDDVHLVKTALQKRDEMDTTRSTAPLQIPLGATVINSTALSIEEVSSIIIDAQSAANKL